MLQFSRARKSYGDYFKLFFFLSGHLVDHAWEVAVGTIPEAEPKGSSPCCGSEVPGAWAVLELAASCSLPVARELYWGACVCAPGVWDLERALTCHKVYLG